MPSTKGERKSLPTNLLGELALTMGEDCCLSPKDLEYLKRRLDSEGIVFLTNTLPKLDKALLQGISQGLFEIPDGFRTIRDSRLPRFMGGLFSSVFYENGEYMGELADPESVERIHQFCCFFYKMQQPYSPELENEFAAKFCDTDASLGNISIDPKDPVIRVATDLVTRIFSGFNPEDLRCKDGPGAVSNYAGQNKKAKKLDYYRCTTADFLPFFFVNEKALRDNYELWPTGSILEPVSKVYFVPKDSRGPRVISAEPRECQFLQQGVAQWMKDRLESHHLTKGFVNFTDQSINGHLALLTSLLRDHATLDLSEASDRVSIQLVDTLFSGLPLLKHWLMTTRSVYTELPNGRRVKLNKFAPMGSATCFPVLATVIWALCKAKYLVEFHDEMDLPMSGSVDPNFYVYGDDIICDSFFALDVIAILHSVGLKVSRPKSFIGVDFAESCGVDAFQGHDVTPVKLRQVPELPTPKQRGKSTRRPLTLNSISNIETANKLADKGYFNTAVRLINHVVNVHGSIPKGTQYSPMVCITNEELHFASTKGKPRKFGYWFIEPVTETCDSENGWTHFMRIIHSIGTHAKQVDFGVFDAKELKVARRAKPKWDSPEYPASNWLPG